jgi:demethylspheroidene O-methyltransferase
LNRTETRQAAVQTRHSPMAPDEGQSTTVIERLRDRFEAWRDRQLSSSAFRRWAAAFPLTRPIARRRASALFDLVAGFSYTQVLLACVRLRLFDRLAQGPASAETLAPQLALPLEACLRLLDAAVALRLLSRRVRRDDRRGLAVYSLGPLGAPMVDNSALVAMVEHHSVLYADLADPVALLRAPAGQAAMARYWAYAVHEQPQALAGSQVADYSALMAASQPLVAEEVLSAYSMKSHRCLLDVGGGEAKFVSAVAKRWPHLRLMVFDLPEVALRAQARLEALGLGARATAIGGDFTVDELPQGADLISLVRVVHDHDDARVLTLLRAARRALPPDGTLLLAEMMAGTPGAQAMGDAYFGLYLWAMGSGRPRRVAELAAMLQATGFTAPTLLRNPMPLQAQVLVARVAAADRL